MCETIVFDHGLQNPNEAADTSDNTSISNIDWQMQALQLNNNDNGDLNQGYYENDENDDSWAGFSDNYPQPQVGSSGLMLSSINAFQLLPPKEAVQPAQLSAAMTAQGITCLLSIAEEELAYSSLSSLSPDDPLSAAEVPKKKNSKKKLSKKTNTSTAAETAAKPVTKKIPKKIQ
jgi:hypothetical protein